MGIYPVYHDHYYYYYYFGPYTKHPQRPARHGTLEGAVKAPETLKVQ